MAIEKIDEDVLEADRDYRFRYVSRFVGFTDQDIDTIHASAGLLIPIMPAIADSFLNRLIDHEDTLRFFAPGSTWASALDTAKVPRPDLNQPHFQQIRVSLVRFLEELFGSDCRSPAFVRRLDEIGANHANAGEHDSRFTIYQINAMMGFLSDRLLSKVRTLGLPRDREIALITAVQKLMWIQMNMMTRHYLH